MAVAIAAQWTGSFFVQSGFYFPYPTAIPIPVPVTNVAGDWLVALVSWRQPQAGLGTTVSVSDDAHNRWEPLGQPSGDSSAAGVTRCAIWYAPAARVANSATGVTNVQVAATGPMLSMAIRILDVSGVSPWSVMSAITPGSANAATSLTLGVGAPASSALMLAVAGSDNNADTITGPGAGWTSLTSVTASNGVDHTADITLSSAWQVTSGAASAAWGASGSLDFSGVTAGILVTGTAPTAPSASWPVVVTEVAIGCGAQTPPSQIAWTALTPRKLATTFTQGRQYTLAQLQAGQGTMTFDNPDGALIPPGTGSFAGIDSGTPVRMRVEIPASATPHYVPVSGYFQRWPFSVPDAQLRGQTQATITDVWGYASGVLNSMAIEEALLDSPYAVWPMTDPAGSAQASNVAPGNSNPLTLTVSKYGAAGAAVVFGANSGALTGAGSAKITASGASGGATGMFQQTIASGQALQANGYGYALACADEAYPPLSAGVTVECFAEMDVSPQDAYPFSAVTAGSNFNSAGTSFTSGQPCTLSVAPGFTLPGGFAVNTVYYINPGTGGNFQLAATPGGSAITVTSSGGGYLTFTTAYNPVVFSLRNVKGLVAEVSVRNTDGALIVGYQTAAGSSSIVAVDAVHDYRFFGGIAHISLALTRTAWRVLVNGGRDATASGSFSASLAPSFDELTFGGIMDRGVQGYAFPGYLAMGAVYPLELAQVRVISHFSAAIPGLVNDAAASRVERILEYANLTGRRWIGSQIVTYEGDLVCSGQDIGGQAAASSAGNIAASTAPAMLYVAPTGDVTYQAKLWGWNLPVRWTLGDNTGAGEIPFLPGKFATDFDSTRVVNDIQLTQLDTQTVTVPSGVTSGTTMAAVEAASQAQYGDQSYQVTGYLEADFTSPYNAGGSLTDLADWIANVNRKPATRVQAVTVDAAARPSAWAFWAGASVGDMVQVNLRLPTAATSPLLSVAARITQTARSIQFGLDGTSATITCTLDAAPEYTALICDDATRGLLNGINVLPW